MRLRVATTLVVSALLSSEAMRVSAKACTPMLSDARVYGTYTRICTEHRAHVMSGFYDIAMRGIDGSEELLGRLRGKVTLAVNVAIRCGLTSQYAGLEQVHLHLRGEDLTIVCFPVKLFAA